MAVSCSETLPIIALEPLPHLINSHKPVSEDTHTQEEVSWQKKCFTLNKESNN
jgi:hypothetical protein